jgi:hypothetical protein
MVISSEYLNIMWQKALERKARKKVREQKKAKKRKIIKMHTKICNHN